MARPIRTHSVHDDRRAHTDVTSYLGRLLPAASPADIIASPVLSEAQYVHDEAEKLVAKLAREQGWTWEAILVAVKEYVDQRPTPAFDTLRLSFSAR